METQASGQQPASNLQARVINILTKPAQEWPVIAAEPKDIAGLYRNYIVLLAAIPAVCGFIGRCFIGVSFGYYGTYRVGIASGLVWAVLQYVMTLVGVYVAAFVVAKLAPSFQSEPDVAQATKLVAYSMTPAWIASVLMIIPMLGLLVSLASLYGLYLMYLGLGPVMKTPEDKKIIYLVVSAVVVILVYVIVGVIVAAVVGTGAAVGGAISTRPPY